MIDVMFTAAKDVEVGTAGVQVEGDFPGEADDSPAVAATPVALTAGKGTWQFTDKQQVQAKREAILVAMGARAGVRYIRKSPAQAWDATHTKRVACTLSKRYDKRPSEPYWYAYHPPWHKFLREGAEAHLLLGCMDLPFAFALPLSVLTPLLAALNTTDRDGDHYWHVKIGQTAPDRYTLLLPKRSDALAIDDYRLPLTA